MNRVVLIGDSIMKGVIYQDERYSLYNGFRFYSLQSNGVKIKNYSRMGATVSHGLSVIEKRDISYGDTVILEFGGNDSNHDWHRISEMPDVEQYPQTPLKSFCEMLRECIDGVRKKGAAVYVANLLPIDSERFFKTISKGLSKENILSWLGDQNMLYRWHEGYNAAVERVAREENCPLIDLRSEFLMKHDLGSMIGPDGIHPTHRGYERVESVLECSMKLQHQLF